MKRPTISDIAEAAGVSKGAVSFALNDRPGVSAATRERILAIAGEMGWQPNAAARNLSVARAEAIGLVIARDAATLGVEPFYMKFIAGLETELSATGTALVLQVVGDHDRAVDALQSLWAARRIDATILTDLWVDDDRVAALDRLGLPGVLVGHPRPGTSMPAVWSDDAAALTDAVAYLAGLGHRRIARVGGLVSLEHTRIRTAAFRTAAGRHRLTSAEVVDTDYTWEAGAWATERLLTAAEPPTAIMFDNDIMATAGLHVSRKLGVDVPGRLSIVAGDDSQLCEMAYPALSALSRDVHAYGANAARVLLSLLAGAPAQDFQDATPRLLLRDSIAPPPR
ncbi:LacI family DNA-binding transcriptional regulator [Dactylosporangium sucinum]|uniref:LacI family transcriptional regulator n=1 Tax=Dactylosporangium sucinum TaxID=1424081 RepID=A0A917TW11_9ACTN|nr:LacI family DNA-binding transcriptional regulator [Dactylosporangium sucinum]GGM40735.1 LacI family transcriptional regulator [Dactylosporangium sucinum]